MKIALPILLAALAGAAVSVTRQGNVYILTDVEQSQCEKEGGCIIVSRERWTDRATEGCKLGKSI
jgi:hypothetical protein